MDINKETLNKVLGMNDEQLRAAIGEIADALGASPSQKRRAQNNTQMIRKKIQNSNENELKRQLGKISEEKQSEILKKLKL